MQRVIGITGGIGSGKSTIAGELAKRGFAVYDCDHEAKRIIAEKEEVRQAIVDLLGEKAFVAGRYNTAYVAQRVFAEPELLTALNAIIHPAVKEDIESKSSKVSPLFIESAILYEAGLDTLCDTVIVVDAPEEVRIARTIARDYEDQNTQENIDKVRARMRTQGVVCQTKPVISVCNDGTQTIQVLVDLIQKSL